MRKQVSKYYILLLLVIIFVAPGVAAYLFYQHPSWLGSSRVNKGDLLNPPVKLSVLDEKPKWRIIFWSPAACDQICMKKLDVLARIRLALGRKLYQVDQWLLISDKSPSLSQEQKAFLKEVDFKVAKLSAADLITKDALLSKAKVFIADPGNYLILSYASQANPEDVYKDLKLLLNATENKSD
ncbi:hypothetical protein FOLKNPGA_03008 [Legionella sp. PC1000]|uniref:hypothetical protein n=1 Tax=Legionella sp. PC1000 TaxID=2746060 RepID=UPI0015FDD78B|nr:hypothetical protein [Legionella sp. PC1000]QLZ70203.1 hypothetical protein FOLKNPGA_03008 [Legionella sp. PC1000]